MLDGLLATLRANHCPAFLVRKLFQQLFSFVNVQVRPALSRPALLRRPPTRARGSRAGACAGGRRFTQGAGCVARVASCVWFRVLRYYGRCASWSIPVRL